MLNKYEIKVKLLGGRTNNFCNPDLTDCKPGDVIIFRKRAHSYENALKQVEKNLSFYYVKGKIL